MNRFALRTALMLVGAGMLNGCGAIWVLGGFTLDAVELPILDAPAEHRFDPSRSRMPANDSPPKITLFAPSLEIELGTTVFLGPNDPARSHYAVSDADNDRLRLNIVSSLDGELPLGSFTFSSPGLRVLTITATNSSGASSQVKLSVNVEPRPSRVTGLVRGDHRIQP